MALLPLNLGLQEVTTAAVVDGCVAVVTAAAVPHAVGVVLPASLEPGAVGQLHGRAVALALKVVFVARDADRGRLVSFGGKGHSGPGRQRRRRQE